MVTQRAGRGLGKAAEVLGKRGNTHKSSCMQKQEDELPFNAAVLTLDRSALRLCVSPGNFRDGTAFGRGGT